jgi:biopolymer transport protein TolQ
MNQEISMIGLIMQASFVVKLVMLGLLVASLASWTLIFNKWMTLKRLHRSNDVFEHEFWSGKNLNDLYLEASKNNQPSSIERVFVSGMREFMKLREKRILDPSTLLDNSRRAMRVSLQREIDHHETHLPFLGSVGSVSPYVGLFGTVWGIMHAFVGLSNMQQVTLATVAPSIAEALVATAIGLFAAIPAVVAYNYFARELDRMSQQLDNFVEEFSNILQRNIGAPSAATSVPNSGYQ